MNQEWIALQKAMETMENTGLDYAFRKGRLIIDIDDRGYISTESNTLRAKHFSDLIGRPPIRMFFHVRP